MDPFSGRGKTLLEARLWGRIPLASDLNPIAVALSEAKNTNVGLASCVARVDELESKYDALLYVPDAQVQSDESLLIYHQRTLAQLCYLRRLLTHHPVRVDSFPVGVGLARTHGGGWGGGRWVVARGGVRTWLVRLRDGSGRSVVLNSFGNSLTADVAADR